MQQNEWKQKKILEKTTKKNKKLILRGLGEGPHFLHWIRVVCSFFVKCFFGFIEQILISGLIQGIDLGVQSCKIRFDTFLNTQMMNSKVIQQMGKSVKQ